VRHIRGQLVDAGVVGLQPESFKELTVRGEARHVRAFSASAMREMRSRSSSWGSNPTAIRSSSAATASSAHRRRHAAIRRSRSAASSGWTLEDELDTSMKARIEQSEAWNEFHAKGDNITPLDLQRVMASTLEVQREAILRLAREIDAIAPRQ
jgi:hypothetical protein